MVMISGYRLSKTKASSLHSNIFQLPVAHINSVNMFTAKIIGEDGCEGADICEIKSFQKPSIAPSQITVES